MNIDTFILITAIVCNSLLSYLILLRNPKNPINRCFAAFGTSVILWTTFNYLADNIARYDLLFTRLTLLFGACIGVTLFMLSTIFSRNIASSIKKTTKFFYIFAFFIVVMCLSPLFIKSVTHTTNGASPTVGALYYLYLLYFLISLALLLRNYIKQFKLGSRVEKDQIKLLCSGIVIYAIFALLSNVVLPVLVQNWSSSRYGPIFTIPFIAITGYAMIRHSLFDIRLIVARSAAYTFTLAVAALIYVTPIILLTTYVLHTPLKGGTIIFLVVVTFIVSIIFQSIRSAFNKITNKIFFRDYYEIQDVLDRLGNLLVGSVDPKEIQNKSIKILSEAIKPLSSSYLLKNDISSDRHDLLNHLQKKIQNLIVLDELDSEKDTQIQKLLNDEGIAVAVRLRTRNEDLGFMLMGYKRSGLIYSDTDKRLLTIAADEIAISLQNA